MRARRCGVTVVLRMRRGGGVCVCRTRLPRLRVLWLLLIWMRVVSGGRWTTTTTVRSVATWLAVWSAVVPSMWCTVTWHVWRALVLAVLEWLLTIRGASNLIL